MFETLQGRTRPHYAWIIFGVCTTVFSMAIGVLYNTQGLYLKPVSSALDVSVATFTAQSLFYGLAGAMTLPFVARIAQKTNVRILYSGLLAVYCGAYFCMGLFTKVWMWYIATFLQGVAGAFVGNTILPFFFNRWFTTKRSSAMGMATAICAVVGVLSTVVANYLIFRHDWRASYRVLGLVALAVGVPIVAIFLRRDPKDMGLLPYGVSEEAPAETRQQTYDLKIHLLPGEARIFACVAALSVLSAIMQSFVHHLSSYASTIGLSSVVGGSLITCASIGNMGGKFALGLLNERFGVKRMTLATICLLMLSMLLLAFGTRQLLAVYAGAILSGLAMPMIVLQMPVLTWDMFDRKRYTAIYNTISVGSAFMTPAGNTIMGLLYNRFNSYLPCHLLGFGAQLAASFILLYAYRLRKRVPMPAD